MVQKPTTIPAEQLKSRCMSLLDEVAATGRSFVITRRGRPVATLVPIRTTAASSLRGSVVWEGDIVSPLFPPDHE